MAYNHPGFVGYNPFSSLRQAIPIGGVAGPVMAPGHNHSPPGFFGGHTPPSPYSFQSHYVSTTPPTAYSQPPSPYLLPALPAPATAPTYPHSGFYDAQLSQLFSAWPMDGPAVPDAMLRHVFHAGPTPDLVAMQQQLAQAKADVAAGKYIVENPEPADFTNVVPLSIQYFTPAIDISTIPLIKADPRIHGQPLPCPPMLPSFPRAAPGYTSTWEGALSPI